MEQAAKQNPHRFYTNTPFKKFIGLTSKSKSPDRKKQDCKIVMLATQKSSCTRKWGKFEQGSLNADLP